MSISRETLRQLVDIVDSKDINIIYQILVRFTPEVMPMGDEIEAIQAANESIEQLGTVDYDDIDWS